MRTQARPLDGVAAGAEALRAARRVTALCHRNPDGDTLGAAIAIAICAERMGKQAEVVSPDVPGPVFAFLPRIERVRTRPMLEPDLAVLCDAATPERLGFDVQQTEWLQRARILNIDHHVTNTLFGDVNCVDPTAAATCQVVAALVDHLEIDLDSELATALLTGIVRDSHGFSDRATSGETLRVAARLVDAGAPLADIHRFVLAELPYPTMALWGRMLAAIGQRLGGRITYTTVTGEMLSETGTQQHDADGLVEFMSRSKGSDVTLLFRDHGSSTRVSIRTSEGVDATRLAQALGGGGHASRAGCVIDAPLGTAVEKVLHLTESVLQAPQAEPQG